MIDFWHMRHVNLGTISEFVAITIHGYINFRCIALMRKILNWVNVNEKIQLHLFRANFRGSPL